jgi:hypothetical protein
MPPLTRTITARSANVPVDTIRTLHSELAAVGLPVNGSETTDTRFGSDTEARVREFQKLHHLPETGEVDPATDGIMSLSALVATEGDQNKLRAELKDAIDEVPNSPEYNYWLARYAIMAGDYAIPKTILKLHPDLGGLLTDLGGIIDPHPKPAGPQQPEVPYPENFYSYRQDFVDEAVLADLRGQLQSLTYEEFGASFSPPELIHQGKFLVAIRLALTAVDAIGAWQEGNRHAANRELKLAMQCYQRCQSFVDQYCYTRMTEHLSGSLSEVLPRDTALQGIQFFLGTRHSSDGSAFSAFWGALRWRRSLLSLQELRRQDIDTTIGNDEAFASASAFLTAFTYHPLVDPASRFARTETNQEARLDVLLIVTAAIKVPLAISELHCQLRDFDAAITSLADIVTSQSSVEAPYRFWCEFIEVPFIRLLTLETLMAKADAEYKTGAIVGADQAFPDAPMYQNLSAAKTYHDVMSKVSEDGQYATNVTQARESLATSINQAVQSKDTTSLAFRTLANKITVPTISGVTTAVPGLDQTLAPHQSIAKIDSPDDPRTSNPRVYAIALLATAKLEQIKAGFNYLGYSPDYLPPWRFSFLVERARYFAEHAKNAQRDYLNFLNNAEHEEFQEQSLAQNVDLEKSNVRIETARVGQAQNEVSASQASLVLANQQAQDAQSRFGQYNNFNDMMSAADEFGAVGAFMTLSSGSVLEAGNKMTVSGAQRDLEQQNLSMAITEGHLAADVATKKLAVDQAGLVVAGLQRQATILRHEFAIQNLNYLRNQTLNSDQWFRIANGIRGVSDTYLRYAIQIAFLAQQAYNFEADKRLDVIRFDYDLSDVGSMLAADFLMGDLDTLEQDLVVSQQTRLQEVRYVLSMAREFPETLRKLADTGQVMFSLPLEQLERHFPGLLNLRISSVDVQPIALMGPTRLSVELTHLGTGIVRLKSQPGNSPLDSGDIGVNDDWLPNAGADWPVKIHVSGPDTAVFSGLSRPEAASLSTITASERGAFEGLPGASGWRIDMSMKENQVVPGTLSDVLITFTLSGYYDSALKDAVVSAASAQRPFATTSLISARRTLPDAFYSLVHYGKLDWDVPERMLTLVGTPNELHNVAVILPLLPNGPELGRCYCRYPVRLDVSSGAVNILSALPEFTLVPNGLVLTGTFTGSASTQVAWDFGDNTPLVQTSTAQHIYARPGRYTIVARLVKDGSLLEYRSAVVVSANHQVIAPLIIAPEFSASTALPDGTVTLTVSPPTGVTDVSIDCSAGVIRGWAATGPVTLKLKPGVYTLDFLAMRNLSGRFYSKQRYLPTTPVSLSRGRISTNRTFDPSTGSNTTTSPNPLATQLFGDGSITISPVDRWTLELPIAENPWFTTVSPSDIAEFDGSELDDAVIELEYLVLEKS